MKSDRVWALLLAGVVFVLDQAYLQANPGAAAFWGRRGGPFAALAVLALFGFLLWTIAPGCWAWLLRRVGRREPDYFAPDPSDTEQAAAEEELQRITKMADESAAEAAWQAWLVGEHRREEARFVKRRQAAGTTRASMRRYVKAIRAELELARSLVDAEDPEDSARADVRRLEEELAWAQAELEHMAGA